MVIWWIHVSARFYGCKLEFGQSKLIAVNGAVKTLKIQTPEKTAVITLKFGDITTE